LHIDLKNVKFTDQLLPRANEKERSMVLASSSPFYLIDTDLLNI